MNNVPKIVFWLDLCAKSINPLSKKHYCKKMRLQANLERAEINPKKRMTTNSYDSSTDVFKIDLVYKDTKGSEHELKWLIKVSKFVHLSLILK